MHECDYSKLKASDDPNFEDYLNSEHYEAFITYRAVYQLIYQGNDMSLVLFKASNILFKSFKIDIIDLSLRGSRPTHAWTSFGYD